MKPNHNKKSSPQPNKIKHPNKLKSQPNQHLNKQTTKKPKLPKQMIKQSQNNHQQMKNKMKILKKNYERFNDYFIHIIVLICCINLDNKYFLI